jgi:hypothetical protein
MHTTASSCSSVPQRPSRPWPERPLAALGAPRHHRLVWRRPEPVLDRETLNGIIRKLMSIDTKVARLVEELLETDGEEEADT